MTDPDDSSHIPIPFDPDLALLETFASEMQELGSEPSREAWEAMWQRWVHAGVNTESLALIGLRYGWIDG